MKKRLLFFWVGTTILFLCQPAYSQQIFTVNGFVYNSETREPVPNANIAVVGTQTGTSSDNNGNFKLSLSAGEHSIRVTSIGFSEKEIKIRVPGELPELLRIGLTPAKLEIGEVDVFGNYFLPDRDTSVNRIPISILPAMTTISAVEIEKQGAVTLVDALKFVPGGWTETRGRKTKQFFSVRGQKYPYPDYSINGV